VRQSRCAKALIKDEMRVTRPSKPELGVNRPLSRFADCYAEHPNDRWLASTLYPSGL
jgi:hypothetical protein